MNKKSLKITDLTSLVVMSKDELKKMNIEVIVEKFKPILDEFCALTEIIRTSQPTYNEIFTNFIDKISSLYNLRVNIILVRMENYATNIWGPVFWNFFHLSSILLEYAFCNNKINDILDFSTLIYNIDCILPCPMCASHYQQIKSTPAVKSSIKDISFGYIMTGLQTFHNIVTKNVDSTHEYINIPNRSYFSLIDFAKTYNCIEIASLRILKATNYQRNKVDWQTKIHRLLTILLALSSKESYINSSELIKLILYDDKEAGKINKVTRLSKNEIYDLIINTILLKVDTKIASDNAQIYNQVIYEFYSMYPDIVKKLVNNLSDKLKSKNVNDVSNDDNSNDESNKMKILEILENISNGSYNKETSINFTDENIDLEKNGQ